MIRLLPPDGEHGWTPYAWLFYLSLYVAYPFVSGTTGPVWLAHAAGLVVFLALYFRGYWVDGARRIPIIAGLAVLGAILSPLNPGALTFYIYAAGFVGGSLPRRAAPWWIAGLTAATAMTAWLTGWNPVAVSGVTALTPMIGFVNLRQSEIRHRNATLKLAQDEVARLATLAERDRIAGDLHDLLGHTLSLIVLKAELASKLLSRDHARAAVEIADVERISREALAEVRRAVHGFRSATLADELARARTVLTTAGVAADLPDATAIAAACLPSDVEHALALVLREAVTNVVRHASAGACSVRFDTSDGHARLTVEDDGVGGSVVDGSGFASMRARTRQLGGSLEHDGLRGTRITASVPRNPHGVLLHGTVQGET